MDGGEAAVVATHIYNAISLTHASTLLFELLMMMLSLSLLQVIKMDDCIGAAVEERISAMGNGDIMLLENVRFHPGEEVRGPTNRPRILGLNRPLVVSGSKVEGADPPCPPCLACKETIACYVRVRDVILQTVGRCGSASMHREDEVASCV